MRGNLSQVEYLYLPKFQLAQVWQICDRLDGQKRCFVLYERLDLYLNPGLEATGARGSFVVRHLSGRALGLLPAYPTEGLVSSKGLLNPIYGLSSRL